MFQALRQAQAPPQVLTALSNMGREPVQNVTGAMLEGSIGFWRGGGHKVVAGGERKGREGSPPPGVVLGMKFTTRSFFNILLDLFARLQS